MTWIDSREAPDVDVDEAVQANREMWRERARLHPQSEMYARFFDKLRAGGDCLLPIEVEALGDLAGKRVLHLQCHVGQDSLSLVRRGAEVVAVDFAPEAIDYARTMSRALELPARFVVSDVLTADGAPELAGDAASFDWVFASYGVLCWIRDLERWMRVAAHFLRPGGRLLVVDTHPFVDVFDDEVPLSQATIRFPYFRRHATRWEETGSYADRSATTEANVSYEWSHRIGQIVNAAIAAGLRIDGLDEFPEGYWAKFPGQALDGDGHYRLPKEGAGKVPMIFALRASRPPGSTAG